MKEDLTLEEVSGLAIDVVGAGVDTVRSLISGNIRNNSNNRHHYHHHDNNNGNFICVFECTVVNLPTYWQFTNVG